MGFLIPLLFFVSAAFAVADFTGKRIESVLPLTLMSITLLVYAISWFEGMSISLWIVIVLIALYYCYLVYKIVTKKVSLRELLDRILSPGFIMIVFLYAFVYVMNLVRSFISWDEVSHWGLMVKEMLRLDRFYSVPESVMYYHKNYPPLIPLFETIWTRLAGSYNEAYLYRAVQFLGFSFFMPLIMSVKGKGWSEKLRVVLFLVSLIIIVNLITLEDANFYTSIYVDNMLAIVFAYALFKIMHLAEWTNYDWVESTILLSFLILIKQMSLFFIVIAGLIFIVQFVLSGQYRRFNKVFMIKGLVLFSAPILAQMSWNSYLDRFETSRSFTLSQLNILSIFDVIRGTAETYQTEAFYNFLNALFQKPVLSYPFNITAFQLMIILVGLAYACYWSADKNGKEAGRVLIAAASLGSLAYTVAMLLSYVFSFGSYEGPRLASFVRYMNTYSYAIVVLIYMYVWQYLAAGWKIKHSVLVMAALLFFGVTPLNYQAYIFSFKKSYHVTQYEPSAKQMMELTSPEDEIMVIAQGTRGHVTNAYRYLMTPWVINHGSNSFASYGKPYGDDDAFTADVPAYRIAEDISGFDYVFLAEIDQNFLDTFESFFDYKERIPETFDLYRVEISNDGVKLHFVQSLR